MLSRSTLFIWMLIEVMLPAKGIAQNEELLDTINAIDSSDFQNGRWTGFETMMIPDTDTTVTYVIQGQYLDNVQEGYWQYFYEGNGVLAKSLYYSNGEEVHRREFDPFGRPVLLWSYDSEYEVTIYRTFNNYGMLWIDAIKTPEFDLVRLYHDNGTVWSICERNLKNAPDVPYYLLKYSSNGTLQERRSFIMQRVEHGPVSRYYESGQLQYECSYQFGELDGEYRTFNEDGTLKEVMMYSKGVRLW